MWYNIRDMKRISKAALAALIAFAPLAAGAITLLPECTKTGNCGISDMLGVFINVAEFLLGIVGAVALGYFVYGGFVFILSRGNKGEVDRAFGILKSAVIGIFIIFLSGVFVRFTTRALTGGVSAIPTVGESCQRNGTPPNFGTSVVKGNGLWISIPAGIDGDGKVKPEVIVCVEKETGLTDGAECAKLNDALAKNGRPEKYKCINVSKAKSCVRGLCNLGSDFACCLQ